MDTNGGSPKLMVPWKIPSLSGWFGGTPWLRKASFVTLQPNNYSMGSFGSFQNFPNRASSPKNRQDHGLFTGPFQRSERRSPGRGRWNPPSAAPRPGPRPGPLDVSASVSASRGGTGSSPLASEARQRCPLGPMFHRKNKMLKSASNPAKNQRDFKLFQARPLS